MCATLDTQDGECLANALVDGVRRNLQLGRDFLGRKKLVDEQQTVELPRTQSGNPFCHVIALVHIKRFTMRVTRVV